MTRLSNRMYPVLRIFAEQKPSFGMKIPAAQRLDQRSFRALLIHEWIVYTPIRGFHLTQAGRDAWKEFHTTDIMRVNPNLPLTRYFDPTAYGIEEKKSA